MHRFHWLESKQLDRVTNYSTEVEPLKYAIKNGIEAYYYCSYAKGPKYFGLEGNIIYLNVFKNRYAKALEFQLRVILTVIKIVIRERDSVIMVNQDLIKHTLPGVFINKIFSRNNKFVSDVRTTPTNPDTFSNDMKLFHSKFKTAIKFFSGYSFITPYMETYIMNEYDCSSVYNSVNWSSGVDVKLFNPSGHEKINKSKVFQVFYHGGISVSRGNLTLIKAIELLKNQGLDIELVQVGIVVDQEIKDYIYNNNLSSWCKLMPPVAIEEIPSLIATSDLPVLPFPRFMAWRVSSPIKLMEYLAMGKKVLAPDIEAFTDVFKDRDDLLYYFDSKEKDQVLAIKNVIESIYYNGKPQQVNNECVRFVRSNYTWEKQAEKLFNFTKTL